MSEHQPTHHYSLDKLPVRLEGASNYNTWSGYVRAALMGQDIEGHITGDTLMPTGADADKKQLAEWRKRDMKARSIIMLGVAPTLLSHISAAGMTAKQMWDVLLTQCRRQDMATCMSLLQQLFTTRMVNASSVESHISAMSNIRTQLVDIGEAVEDKVAATALLMSVPSEVPQWEMFLRTQTASSARPSWDAVAAAIRAEASMQQQRERMAVQTNTPVAAAYAASFKQQGKQTGDTQRPFCYSLQPQGSRDGHVLATAPGAAEEASHYQLRHDRGAER